MWYITNGELADMMVAYRYRTFLARQEHATMTAALGNYLGQSTRLDRLMLGIAGAVSIVIPISILVLVFQRYIVAGMTAGAVKG